MAQLLTLIVRIVLDFSEMKMKTLSHPFMGDKLPPRHGLAVLFGDVC